MKRFACRFAAATLLVAAFAASANAATVLVTFSGMATGGRYFGQNFDGSFLYDSNSAPTLIEGNEAYYDGAMRDLVIHVGSDTLLPKEDGTYIKLGSLCNADPCRVVEYNAALPNYGELILSLEQNPHNGIWSSFDLPTSLNMGDETFAPSDLWMDGEALFTSFAMTIENPTSGAPEPATWAMMIVGLGLAGAAMRRRNKAAACIC